MRLLFRLNEQLNGSYESPYGTLLLTSDTKQLFFNSIYKESLLQGEFNLAYDLLMQGSPVGKYTMSIKYKEELDA
jgi:uncharacterized beta-barrel protein YwiB (DUF1934 family)